VADETQAVVEEREPEEQGEGPMVLTSSKSSQEEPLRMGEADVVEWVEGLYDDASKSKDDQCDPRTWDDDLSTFWGEMWQGSIPSYKPRIVVNEIKSLLLQELSDLTDSRLMIYVQKSKGSTERDKGVEQSIQTYWTREFCDLTVLMAALDAMIYPLGFLQTGWDPFAKDGQGEVIFKHRDPRTVFPDGDAEDDDTLRYFCLEDIMDLVEIRKLWPETGRRVTAEADWSTKVADTQQRPGPKAGSGYTGPLYSKTGMSGSAGYIKARARLLTCVVQDDEQEEELNEVAGVLRQVNKYKYPHRRMIQIANKRVLYDDDCPYHYAPILTRVMMQPAVHSYWPAQSLVGEFAEIQKTANKADSMVAENMLRLNAGMILADADSGINPKTFGNIPGMVYLIKPGSKVAVNYPTPMPADMVGAGERFRGMIRSTMGYPTSRTGAGTHGNVAAELAETEISQAMGLTRLRGRLLYQSVQRAVAMIFARMGQFYSTPRHLVFPDQGDLKSIKWEPVPKPEEYTVHVDESSFQVRSKTMMQRLAIGLAKMNKLPDARLLKILEFPDADAIAKELKEQLMLQALARQKQPKGKKS
jgi:hypothetical protein